MDITLITTGNELSGYRIVKNLGIVRGITVRSRSIAGNFAGGIMSLFGGKNSIYTELCEQTRQEAYIFMVKDAERIGANAIIGMRYDANDVMQGITEVLSYGTGVWVEKI
jgi:uncharacterized protein YbjQ (UPF0145 family)